MSVVIPCFDPDPTELTRTLSSVLQQDWTDIEIAVVDDGSPVPFGGLDQAGLSRDARVRWCALRENRGVAGARNAGVREGSGRWIAFLDVGDWWEPAKIREQVEAAATDPECALVYCSAMFHGRGRVTTRSARLYDSAYRELLVRQPITGSASSAMILRSVFNGVGGFYEGEDIPEDRDLWLRIAGRYRVCAVRQPLVHIAVRPNSRSADAGRKSITYKRFLQRHKKSIVEEGLWNEALAHYHLVIAKKYLRTGRVFRAVVSASAAGRASPRFVLRGMKRWLLRAIRVNRPV